MKTYARWLFGIAGGLNVLVGLALLLAEPQAVARAGLDPVHGINLALIYFAGTMIALFGYGYIRIAAEPARYRPLIHIGALGKILAVASAALPWLAGQGSSHLAGMLAPDLIFAILFLDYLRRTPKPERASGKV